MQAWLRIARPLEELDQRCLQDEEAGGTPESILRPVGFSRDTCLQFCACMTQSTYIAGQGGRRHSEVHPQACWLLTRHMCALLCIHNPLLVYCRTRRQAAAQGASSGLQEGSARATQEEVEGEGERLILGLVEPGDSLPLPFGWRHGGTVLYWLFDLASLSSVSSCLKTPNAWLIM